MLATGIALLTVTLAFAATVPIAADSDSTARVADHPNIVLITTDDESVNLLWVMRRTRRVITDHGTKFSRAFATFPLCCPARATWLTGQYAHNHGLIDNRARHGGGYPALRDPKDVLPVWLRSAGYETAFAGKWFHDYRSTENAPGWDVFHSLLHNVGYYRYSLTDSHGGSAAFGDANEDYLTDTLTDRIAVPFIRTHAASPKPFFLHVAYTAPHWGGGRNDRAGRRCASPKPFRFENARPKPAARHAGAYSRAPLPQPPSFNERNLSDKPASVANKRRVSSESRRALEKRYRCELATLLSVDEGVARINAALLDAGIENNTVMIFTTDHGYMTGEHRLLGGKIHPYEETVRVPFLIKGPGIPAGNRTFEPAANVDLAPTILDLAGADSGSRVLDGVSLLRTLRGEESTDRAVLLEAKRSPHRSKGGGFDVRSWIGVRTRRYTYIERRSAEVASAPEAYKLQIGAGDRVARELYDNKLDPYQLRSRHRSRRYEGPRKVLVELLGELSGCQGSACVVEASVPEPGPAPAASAGE